MGIIAGIRIISDEKLKLRNELAGLRIPGITHTNLQQGIAPSYFLEGMMWNVPNAVFAMRYQDTTFGAVRWLRECDKSQLVCANDIHWLLREGHSISWRERSFDAFLSAIESYWNR